MDDVLKRMQAGVREHATNIAAVAVEEEARLVAVAAEVEKARLAKVTAEEERVGLAKVMHMGFYLGPCQKNPKAYIYDFHPDPEDHQPTGTLNMKKIIVGIRETRPHGRRRSCAF